jgi:excisionase family DNA binding protein
MANARPFDGGSSAELIATTLPFWQELGIAARTLPADALPDFLSSLEKVRVLAFARLMAPAPNLKNDELVGIEEAARRLGISKHYLYRHAGQFPFVRHIGRKLLFSSLGIDRYITTRR